MTQWNPYFYDTSSMLPLMEGDDMEWDDGSQASIPMREDDDNAWIPPTYARGGYVPKYALEGVGSLLRSAGRDGDTILAHINPQEAALLKSLGGRGSLNPMTGLPEYGFGKSLKRAVKKSFKWVPAPVKKSIGPVVGSIGGTIIGGPVGGAIGGAIGGSMGPKNRRVGPVIGGVGGYFGGPALVEGGKAVLAAGGMDGMLSGMSQGFGQSTGLLKQGVSALLGGGDMTGNDQIQNALYLKKMGMSPSGGSSSLMGGVGSLLGGVKNLLGKDPLGTALLGTAVLGTLGRRERQEGPETLAEAVASAFGPQWRPDQFPTQNLRPLRRKYKPFSQNYRAGFDPEEEAFEEEDSPWQLARGGYVSRYAQGGYLDGYGDGQDDDVPALLSEGEYVIPADVVSDIGDGNSMAGARHFNSFIENVRAHKKRKSFPPQSLSLGQYFERRS